MASFMKRSVDHNRAFKRKLQSGEPVTMIHTSHASASLVEKLGEFGFDAVMIDCEHGPAGPETVEQMARAANLSDVVSIVRPEDAIPHFVTRYIECGADGLMVPMVSDAATAQAMVDRLRFSAPFDHQDRFLILMIETVDAVNRLPEILAVEGVDAYLVAPGDLAVTMNLSPVVYEWQDGVTPAAVEEAVDHAIKTIVDAGKVCGTLVNHGNVGAFLDKGVRLLYDHANHMLARGARDFFDTVRAAK
jgi:4-hydroxy-2-oxoheptanedioate aldolase